MRNVLAGATVILGGQRRQRCVGRPPPAMAGKPVTARCPSGVHCATRSIRSGQPDRHDQAQLALEFALRERFVEFHGGSAQFLDTSGRRTRAPDHHRHRRRCPSRPAAAAASARSTSANSASTSASICACSPVIIAASLSAPALEDRAAFALTGDPSTAATAGSTSPVATQSPSTCTNSRFSSCRCRVKNRLTVA